MVLGWCAVDGTVPSATCGQEAGLLILGQVVPDCFGLEVVKHISEPALEGFNLVAKRLLEV